MVLAQLGAEVIAVEPLAGPLATRLLADLGATVVRIENERRLDVIRASGTFLSGEEGGDEVYPSDSDSGEEELG